MDLFNGQHSFRYQFCEKSLTVANPRPLWHMGNRPVGQKPWPFIGEIKMSEIENLKKLGFANPLVIRALQNLQNDIMGFHDRHGLTSCAIWLDVHYITAGSFTVFYFESFPFRNSASSAPSICR